MLNIIHNPRGRKEFSTSYLFDDRSFAKSLNDYLILLAVEKQQGIQGRTAGREAEEILKWISSNYEIHISKIYPTLSSFVKKGWIKSGNEAQPIYKITREGVIELRETGKILKRLSALLNDISDF